MSLDHLYNSSFSTQRPVTTQNQMGAGSELWSTNISSFTGRLQRKRTSEFQALGKTEEHSDYVLYCDTLNDITALDRVVFGTRTFEVITVDNVNQTDTYLKVELLEIR